jgi:hypothetical protein
MNVDEPESGLVQGPRPEVQGFEFQVKELK